MDTEYDSEGIPVKAIQRSPRTATRPRYRTPAISIGEFKAQKDKES